MCPRSNKPFFNHQIKEPCKDEREAKRVVAHLVRTMGEGSSPVVSLDDRRCNHREAI
jgi:hypothetical protein